MTMHLMNFVLINDVHLMHFVLINDMHLMHFVLIYDIHLMNFVLFCEHALEIHPHDEFHLVAKVQSLRGQWARV